MAMVAVWIPSMVFSADNWVAKPTKQSTIESHNVDPDVMIYSASYALVIGIDAYDKGWPRLHNSVKDAKIVAETLASIGFEVDLRTNLTSQNLANTIKEFYVSRGTDDNARLLFWFAGHGHTIKGEGFLVPADAPLDSDPNFKLKALHMRDFGSYVRLAESKHAFAIFDSCFSGTIFDASRSAPPPLITFDTARPVRQFLSSGDATQTVIDDGTFRKVFVDAVLGKESLADSNQDGYLTASELGMFMSSRILNLTQGRQTPRFGKLRDRDWDRGDFVLTVPSGSLRLPSGGRSHSFLADHEPNEHAATTITIQLASLPQKTGPLRRAALPTPIRTAPVAAAPPIARSSSDPKSVLSMAELMAAARKRQSTRRHARITALADNNLELAERASKRASCSQVCTDQYRDVEHQRYWVSERRRCDSADSNWDQCVERVKEDFRKRLIGECVKKC